MRDTGTTNPKPCKTKCTCYWTRTSQAQDVKRLKLGGGQLCGHSADQLQFQRSCISQDIACRTSLHSQETSVYLVQMLLSTVQ
jgi:hypothetical protein